MRLAFAGASSLRFSPTFRIPVPGKSQAAVLVLLCLAFEPAGSFPALGIYGGFIGLLLLSRPLRGGQYLSRWAGMAGFLTLAMLLQIPLWHANLALFLLYLAYWTFAVLTCGALSDRIQSWDRRQLLILVKLVLAADLALNLPSCLIEIVRLGVGDWITGLSGLLLPESLSQNRTNSVRAVLLIILATANFRMQRNALSLVSILFNAAVLLLATSMTTVVSAMAAVGFSLLFRRRSAQTLLFLGILALLLIAANAINQYLLKTDSIFDFFLELNSKWIPKLDIYRQYLFEILPNHPWMALIGGGHGNISNRFAVLANFQNYSVFPGKAFVSELMSSDFTKRYLVDYYGLEKGIVGHSIVSTPWSGLMALILEWGVGGIGVGIWLAWPFLKRLWRCDFGYVVGSGRFLFAFMFLNLAFDCYLDYPEVLVPLLIIACLLTALSREKDALGGSVHE